MWLIRFGREYDAAIARGDGAYLLEEEKADVFKVKVAFAFTSNFLSLFTIPFLFLK